MPVNIGDVITAALFCFAMVFALLGSLYVLVILSTRIIRAIESKMQK